MFDSEHLHQLKECTEGKPMIIIADWTAVPTDHFRCTAEFWHGLKAVRCGAPYRAFKMPVEWG